MESQGVVMIASVGLAKSHGVKKLISAVATSFFQSIILIVCLELFNHVIWISLDPLSIAIALSGKNLTALLSAINSIHFQGKFPLKGLPFTYTFSLVR
jgi:hypothetical protein